MAAQSVGQHVNWEDWEIWYLKRAQLNLYSSRMISRCVADVHLTCLLVWTRTGVGQRIVPGRRRWIGRACATCDIWMESLSFYFRSYLVDEKTSSRFPLCLESGTYPCTSRHTMPYRIWTWNWHSLSIRLSLPNSSSMHESRNCWRVQWDRFHPVTPPIRLRPVMPPVRWRPVTPPVRWRPAMHQSARSMRSYFGHHWRRRRHCCWTLVGR
jgi:hypothetical protein